MVKKVDTSADAPKKPMNPEIAYRMEVYDEVKKQHPDADTAELSKIIADLWDKLDEEAKKKHEN